MMNSRCSGICPEYPLHGANNQLPHFQEQISIIILYALTVIVKHIGNLYTSNSSINIVHLKSSDVILSTLGLAQANMCNNLFPTTRACSQALTTCWNGKMRTVI